MINEDRSISVLQNYLDNSMGWGVILLAFVLTCICSYSEMCCSVTCERTWRTTKNKQYTLNYDRRTNKEIYLRLCSRNW